MTDKDLEEIKALLRELVQLQKDANSRALYAS
jgi:hypothetical protein